MAGPAPAGDRLSLRVGGGEARGRRLFAPRGIRPTQGLVREAIFDLLASELDGARVLDLFAGSGALGIEALSRGARHATFVERSEEGVASVRRNLEALGYEDRAEVARADVVRWLRAHAEAVGGFSIVLLDPPYGDPVQARALAAIEDLAGPRALVVVERPAREPLPALSRLSIVRDRRYGDTSGTIARA